MNKRYKNEPFLQHFCNITLFLLIIKKENETKKPQYLSKRHCGSSI